MRTQPERSFVCGFQLEEAHLSLRHAFQLPLGGLPSSLWLEMRRRAREGVHILGEQGVPDALLSPCVDALDALISSKRFADLVQGEHDLQDVAIKASQMINQTMVRITRVLEESDFVAFYSGWAHARLGLAARLHLRAPAVFASTGETGAWEGIAFAGIRDVFNTIQAEVPLRRGHALAEHVRERLGVETVYEAINDLAGQAPTDEWYTRLQKRVDDVLARYELEPLSEWTLEALEYRTGVQPLWRPGPEDLKRQAEVLGATTPQDAMFQRTGDLGALDRSIAIVEDAVRDAEGHPMRATFLDQLAGRLWERSQAIGSRLDQDRSIALVRECLRTIPIYWEMDGLLSNLGLSLTTRFEQGGDATNIVNAVDSFDEATYGQTEPEGRELIWWTNYANALRLRFHSASSDVADLDEAIRRLRIVLAATPTGHPDEGIRRQNLANILRERLEHAPETNSARDLAEAIDLTREALNAPCTPPGDRPAAFASLASAYAQRFDLFGEKKDLEREREAVRACIREGETLRANVALSAARIWCDRAFARRDWEHAVEAFEAAMRCSQNVMAVQVARTHRESALSWSQGLAAKGAYALVQLGETKRAVRALESGLARMLSIELDSTRGDIERLRREGHDDLHDRYVSAANAFAAEAAKLDKPRTGNDERSDVKWSELSRLRQNLEDALVEIRSLPGFASLLTDLAFEEIASLTPDRLTYVFSTRHGGAALVVDGGDARHVELPFLTHATERALVERHLTAMAEFLVPPRTVTDRDVWSAELEDMLTDLSKSVLASLGPFHQNARIAWVLVGTLQLLPLHAAPLPGSDGERLFERTRSYYVPNARALTEGSETERSGLSLVKVGHSQGLTQLPDADLERDILSTAFEQIDLLEEDAATRDAVLARLGSARVAHFSCHGKARLDRPLESALYVAGAQPLTVADLLGLSNPAGRLVSLSACETGIAGMTLPDEVIGMPAALLGTGSRQVLSTLWVVEDRAATFFFGHFYRSWIVSGLPPLDAFVSTQRWLRSATNAELVAFLEEAGPWPAGSPAKRTLMELKSEDDNATPFAAVTTWAPFVWTGVGTN